MRERERGGRCGGEERERDVCMGVIRALAHSPVAFEVKRGVSWFEAFCASLSEPNPPTSP